MTLEFILRICLNTTPVLYSPVLISEFHRPGILGFACVLLLRGLLPFCNNITDLRTRNIGFTIKMVTKYKKSLSSRVCVCVSDLQVSLKTVLKVFVSGVIRIKAETGLTSFPHACVLVQPTLKFLYCG